VSLAVCVSACGTGAGCPLSCTEEQANVLLFFFFVLLQWLLDTGEDSCRICKMLHCYC